nr:SDR family NAD(P)-dependent oxidoreductase [Gemmatimonadota bacterium]NIU69545.1 SDR family NAD(P)-dependent oxidoreductase [Actinomycetota bacterium]NIQ53765.1 SDR family NAD(P)-dependent oxidoreductase [Gemmatimonadota bacterium]NIW27357.1 SDR family NAD(P)-dependent oxidoreductase [Actinomycetota bacterium]NIX19884.1 SDR family NAD(P)-dependent oxidoreductase [Actinomycetota bacterium]
MRENGGGFDGRSYVVLGATGGIGRAVAERLAGAGARLVLGARSEDELEALADELGAVAHPLDAREFGEVDEVIDRAVEEHGGLDGVVN